VVLPKVKRTSLVDKIVDIIIGKINNNEFNVGETLPSETEMSKQFGVSRATIRETTAYLIGMGIIERNENGLTITQLPSSAIFNDLSSFIDIGIETQSLYEARIIFDIGFAYLASSKATDKDIDELIQLNENIIGNLDNKELYWEKDLEFHYRIARIANNDFLFSIYDRIMKSFTHYLESNGKKIFNQTEIVKNTPVNHKVLINALKGGESMKAIDVTLKSLDVAMVDMISRKIREAIPEDDNTNN
jgi:GntR family transcriptional regulator, transcriptional repressor for pyruvate dehydrogenase complex